MRVWTAITESWSVKHWKPNMWRFDYSIRLSWVSENNRRADQRGDQSENNRRASYIIYIFGIQFSTVSSFCIVLSFFYLWWLFCIHLFIRSFLKSNFLRTNCFFLVILIIFPNTILLCSYDDISVMSFIKMQRLTWVGRVLRAENAPQLKSCGASMSDLLPQERCGSDGTGQGQFQMPVGQWWKR